MGTGSLIQRITYKISGRSSTSSGLYTPSTSQYDYAIGGIPLLSATTDQRPDTEKLVEQRKQQFENYKDPGEYSLQQWWLRSQSSFIGGAGVIYQDPDTQGQSKNIRFNHSVGVDPFSDVRNLQLLKECNVATINASLTSATGPCYVSAFPSSLGDLVYIARGNQIVVGAIGTGDIPAQAPGTFGTATSSAFLAGSMPMIASAGTAGGNAFNYLFDAAAPTQVGIWRTPAASGPLTPTPVLVYPTPTTVSTDVITLHAARGSLCAGINQNLYVLDPYATAGTALPAFNAKVVNGQKIVSITDGPDAIYVGANSPNRGYIYKTVVDNAGIVNGLQLTAVMPDGELINDAQAYVNTYMVLATTLGIRVGSFTPGFSGAIFNYGPKVITVPRTGLLNGPESGSGFGRIQFYGSRAYVCTQGSGQHDGLFGLMAVDLATTVQDVNTGANFNAWSTWDYVAGNTNPITDLAVSATGRPIFTYGSGSTAKVALEHRDNYISSGYMDTGRCRFNTLEPKLFKYFSVRVETPLNGNLTVTLLDDSGGITNYITYGPTLDPGNGDIATPTPTGPHMWEALRFTLNRGAMDPTVGARLAGWQIKALPGVLKQRNIVRNFLMFNNERDKSGQYVGNDSSALDNLTAIRQMAQRGDTITLQDLVNNISTQVIIDDYQITMMAPPGPNKENYGGYLTLNMRTVADSVPPVPTIPPGVD